MNILKSTAFLMIVVAALIGVVPQFTDCTAAGNMMTMPSGMKAHMVCHWSARAEIAVAVPLLFTAGFMATSTKRNTLRWTSIIAAVLGVFVIALPTVLIGVCANPEMICNTFMRPFLILTGSVIVVLGIVGAVLSGRSEEAI